MKTASGKGKGENVADLASVARKVSRQQRRHVADPASKREVACAAVLKALRQTLGTPQGLADEWEAARAAEVALALYCTGQNNVFRVILSDTRPRTDMRGFIG